VDNCVDKPGGDALKVVTHKDISHFACFLSCLIIVDNQ
jgi:hypothetical protein